MFGLRILSATYRLQFHHGFRFITAQALVPYLHDLGISDLYASPFFTARRRSLHGYSVTNPLEINPELGSRVSLSALGRVLKSLDMGLLLDIVPNHMALSHDNPWWLEVLEDGPASPYAVFFDVDWHPPHRVLDGKVLLPILGKPYGQTLESMEIRLALEDGGFLVYYYDHKCPLDPKTYSLILNHRLETLVKELGEEHPAVLTLKGLITLAEHLPPRTVSSKKKLLERQRQKVILKKKLWLDYQGIPAIKEFVDENLVIFNGKAGEPESFNLLDQLLRLQPYRLAHWLFSLDLINYRRFFSVNDLIGLRVEDLQVFEASHNLLFRLIREGKVSGLRIDHIDGLFDPEGYLRRLQDRLSEVGAAGQEGFYVVVEKILAEDESMPQEWPVAGTTGYDFLARVNSFFIEPHGLEQLKQIYVRFTHAKEDLDEVIYDKKKLMLETLFGGEVETLGHHLCFLSDRDRHARDISRSDLYSTLKELIACLPQYRSYIRSFEVSPQDLACLEQAFSATLRRNPSFNPLALDFLKRVLFLNFPSDLPDDQRKDWLQFIMRWQQFTGPVMAKGIEDTACYIYNPLVSLNEVGGSFCAVSVDNLHRFNQKRLLSWPQTLNATSTHDTKRSEDVRARINVLSEIPQEWEGCLTRWSDWNQSKKRCIHGMTVPDPNEEYFLYQTLIGAWPLFEDEVLEFKERLKTYTVKAIREAKVHTRWIATNHEYESALTAFVEDILDESDNQKFLKDFQEFQARLAYYGALNSLSQVLLKIASPGVPDFYQGTELWDFSLVDPDNRRPVDFKKRAQLLNDLKIMEAKDPESLIQELLRNWKTGAIKLFITYKALNLRKNNLDLFFKGDYIPIETQGPNSDHIAAFARRLDKVWVAVVVARHFTNIISPENISFSNEAWEKSFLFLPNNAPKELLNIFTGERVTAILDGQSKTLPLANLFRKLPAVLLSGRVA